LILAQSERWRHG